MKSVDPEADSLPTESLPDTTGPTQVDVPAEVKAMLDAGRYKDARARATPALAEAQELAHRPLIAEAQELEGVARDRNGDLEGAIAALSEAVWIGTAARR